MRRVIALISNLLLPGAGLILLRREWLGLAHAGLFCLALHLGIWGTWIVPAALPDWLPRGAFTLAALVWAASQWLCIRQSRVVCDPNSKVEIEQLNQIANEHLTQGRAHEAIQFLDIAIKLDDENQELKETRAEFATKLSVPAKESLPDPDIDVIRSPSIDPTIKTDNR
jgi:hypothetical protein